mmetsp:Transcript_31799/g.62109  ORF Transcript_31799/g.62109 Transcript_31799/m.62109 type:complete len:349 (+) Transcript_31799:191-1237(+)
MWWGMRNIAFVSITGSSISRHQIERAKEFDCIIVGSEWNKKALTKQRVNNVEVLLPGVPSSLFRLATSRVARAARSPSLPHLEGRFVVLAAGPLSFAGGADIVVAAFKKFLQMYPESNAVLAVSWRLPLLPSPVAPAAGGGGAAAAAVASDVHIQGLVTPFPTDDQYAHQDHQKLSAEVKWLVQNQVPPGSALNLGEPLAQHFEKFAAAHADVAVFPDRVAGVANTCALTAVACGVPTVVSGIPGHSDLISIPSTSAALQAGQAATGLPAIHKVAAVKLPAELAGKDKLFYRQVEVQAVADAIAAVYLNRPAAEAAAQQAARWVHKHRSWESVDAKLVNLLGVEALGT